MRIPLRELNDTATSSLTIVTPCHSPSDRNPLVGVTPLIVRFLPCSHPSTQGGIPKRRRGDKRRPAAGGTVKEEEDEDEGWRRSSWLAGGPEE